MNKIIRIIFIIPFFLVLSVSLFGTDEINEIDAPLTNKKWIWTLSPIISMHLGQANEIVYDTSGVKNQNDYLSLLKWGFSPVFGVGIKLAGDSGKRFGFDFEGQSAIAGFDKGLMLDFDWFFTDRNWSHYSISETRLRWGFTGDFGLNWRVVKRTRFQLRLGFALHADWWAWTDTLKDSKYSKLANTKIPRPYDKAGGDDFRSIKDTSNHGKNAIDYQVLYSSFLATIGMDVIGKVLFVNFRGRIGPALTLDIDNHKLRSPPVEFRNTIFGGPWVDLSLSVGVKFSERVSFAIRAQYAYLFESKGNTTQVQNNQTSFSRNSAGSSFDRFSVGAFLIFNLKSQNKDEG